MNNARLAGMIVLTAVLSACATEDTTAPSAPAEANAAAPPAAATGAPTPSSAEAQQQAAASTVTVAPAGVSTPTQTLTVEPTPSTQTTNAAPAPAAEQTNAAPVSAAPAGAGQGNGKIRVCKLGDSAAKDSVYLPADGTYSISCTIESKCRHVKIAVTAPARLSPGRGSCATLDAVLVEGDGQPIAVGQHLVADWSTGTFMPVVSVVKAFK